MIDWKESTGSKGWCKCGRGDSSVKEREDGMQTDAGVYMQ